MKYPLCMLPALLLAGVAPLFAADSLPPEGDQAIGSVQPRFAGYRSQDIENWSPQTDPYAESLRAWVPLQKRIAPFKPTQARPDLDSHAEVMLMQGDYGNSFFDSYTYNNTFSEHVLNFWQYADYYSPWHGAATASTPKAAGDVPESDWMNRGFEFGVVNIPNPAYTNAAHKNGVRSIAVIYFDQAFRPEQSINELFKKNAKGEFVAAKKLIEMARYFGYDGYFFNCEEEPANPADREAFLTELHKAGLWTQYYDTGNNIESKADKLSYQDSIFVNYGWTRDQHRLADAAFLAAHPEIDPYTHIFYGVESNQGKLNGEHPSEGELDKLYIPGSTNLQASVALFTPSDYYQRGLGEDAEGNGMPIASEGPMPVMQTNEFQWMIAARERLYFSGPQGDPSLAGKTAEPAERSDIALQRTGGWPGVAEFIAERSVLSGSVFYTDFNTGHGMEYAIDGRASGGEWSNINIQDVLPTWQWRIDAEGERLNADFDYGPLHIMKDREGNTLSPAYTPVGAYRGGSSLVVYGELTGKNTLYLYKSDLALQKKSVFSITFKKISADTADMRLALIFKDDPTAVQELPIEAGKSGEWTTVFVPLDAYAGRHIAAIGLVFDGTGPAYQMNIGSLRLTDGKKHTPSAPKRFRLKTVHGNGETELSWKRADYSKVRQYNAYALTADGSRIFLNGIYGDSLYVKSLPAQSGILRFELTAVGTDGSESRPAVIDYDFNRSVSSLVVEEALTPTGLLSQSAYEGVLHASWTPPVNADFSSYRVTVELRDTDTKKTRFTYKFDKNTTDARIPLPVRDGERYTLSVATVKGLKRNLAVSYSGRARDVWSAPLVSDDFSVSADGREIRFVNPQSNDWQFLSLYADGELILRNKRGATIGSVLLKPIIIRPESNEIELTRKYGDWPIQEETYTVPYNPGAVLTAVLTDYSGNDSEPVMITRL